MIRTRILSALAATVIAATTATPALAGGERKNESPFTSPAVTSSALTGEAKNRPPFSGSVQPQTIVLANAHDGFSWLDAAIGAAAGVGATCATGALAAFAWTARRSAATAQ
jgi:hypothetical protein